MTVSSTTNRNSYTGNDTTSNYTYSFKIFQDEDLLLVVRNTTTDLETELVLGTDFSVNDAGEQAGGTIDLIDNSQAWISGSSFLDTGYILSVRRVLALTQETDIRNQGDFYPEIHEDVFDKGIMINQQHQDELDRSVRLSESISPGDFDATIPPAVVGSNSLALVTNVAGDAFELGPTVSAIAGAQAEATAAAASAAAALVSENNAAQTEADLLAFLALNTIEGSEVLLDNTSNEDIAVTIDEVDHYSGVLEYFAVRGAAIEYGRIAIIDESPFTVSILEKVGDVGLTFAVTEAAGVGTINYTTTSLSAGTIRYKFIKFGV